jgi:predicted phosphodiesterase
MRILILSDLHREVWRDDGPVINPDKSMPDIVVLAGDIDNGDKAVGWARDVFQSCPVLYVPGNHEYYGGSIEQIDSMLAHSCATTTNVRYLNRNETILNDVRFLGVTLWTDYNLFGSDMRSVAMQKAKHCMLDYERIKVSESGRARHLRPEDTTILHTRDSAWLEERLAEPFLGATVVITHMAPSRKSIAPKYADDPTSAGFASSLENLVAQCDLWIHGHTHDSFDYQVGRGRVVANPCGYRTRGGGVENAAFDPNLVVSI